MWGGIANLSTVLENGCRNAMPTASLSYFPVNWPCEATTKPHLTHALANTQERKKTPEPEDTKKQRETH